MSETHDFPYYAGQPVQLEGRHWLTLMASLVVAFAALTLLRWESFPVNLIPALLFLIIPLLALRQVAGPHWAALFRPVGLRDIVLMVVFAAITLIGSIMVALVLNQIMTLNGNPVAESMGSMSFLDVVMRLVPTIPQLIGEELLGILPFLAVLWLCVTRLGLSRRVGILIALVVSALVFGAAHLPTYDWNWGQALLGIGAARVFLTLAFIATRNLWVSAGAHIMNDWFGFLANYAASHSPIGTDL